MLSFCGLAGCATLMGALSVKDAHNAASICQNALADVATIDTLAKAQISDPKALEELAKVHDVVVKALQDCVEKGK